MWMIVRVQNTVDVLNIIWGHADAIWVQGYWDKNTKTIITNMYCFICDYNYIRGATQKFGEFDHKKSFLP